jgi:PAS domain S-box-containing protein/putative nucleotidyltransferase with HDIG domain
MKETNPADHDPVNFELEGHINDFCIFLSLPFVFVRPDGVIADANQNAEELLGYAPGELTKKNFFNLTRQKDRLSQIAKSTLGRDQVRGVTCRLLAQNGREIQVRISTIVRRDPQGEITGYYAVFTDLSEHEQTKEALNQVALDLDKRNRQLGRILNAADSLLIRLGIDELLKEIVRAAHESLGFNIVLLNLIDRDTGEIRTVGHAGLDQHNQQALDNATVRMTWKDFTKILDEKYRIGRCYFIPHGAINWSEKYNYPAPSSDRKGIRNTEPYKWHPEDALFALVEIGQEQVVGMICVDQPKDGFRPAPETIQALEIFANLAGVAMENSRLYEQLQKELGERKMAEQALLNAQNDLERIVEERTAELGQANQALKAEIAQRVRADDELKLSLERIQKTLDSTVRALSSVLALRDPYTANHQQRVTELACAIAREMGLPQESIDALRFAGLLHDIGKIGITAEILNKPTRLDKLEMNLIKTHPQLGYEILKTVDFSWPVADIVLQHHERLDGSGYPKGLKGNEILYEAKILGVADVVEAMSSHRPYRPAFQIALALDEIIHQKGVLYDPQIVDICIKILTDKNQLIT